MSKKWKLISDFTLFEYKSGIQAGDKLRLRKPLELFNNHGGVYKRYFPNEGTWIVLPTSTEDPVIRLSRSNGEVLICEDVKMTLYYFLSGLKKLWH